MESPVTHSNNSNLALIFLLRDCKSGWISRCKRTERSLLYGREREKEREREREKGERDEVRSCQNARNIQSNANCLEKESPLMHSTIRVVYLSSFLQWKHRWPHSAVQRQRKSSEIKYIIMDQLRKAYTNEETMKY